VSALAGSSQHADPEPPPPGAASAQRLRGRAPQLAALALAAVPGALSVFLAFHAGGFFVGTTGLAVVLILGALILRVTLAQRPFAGLGWAGGLATGALGLLAVWALASAWWSDAASRALLSFDLTLLYAALVLLMGSVAWLPRSVRTVLRLLAVGIVAVCTVALITRVLPNVWHVAPDLRNERLSYPLTYWNGLGAMAAVGLVLCLHLTCDALEPRAVRALSAAALPVLAATLLFTYSRGAIAACAVGAVLYLLVAHPRGMAGGLPVALPATAVGALLAYRADLLATPDFATRAGAVHQGHRVALGIAVCALCAGLLRFALTWLDARLARVELPQPRRPVRFALGGGALLVVVALALALGAPHALSTQYHRFTHGDSIADRGDFRTRLTNAGNNGRIEHWRVALKAFSSQPLHGTGGGTYQNRWTRDRHVGFTAVNAHSLYLETLSDLGVVGLVLLLVALGALAVGIARRARGPQRALYGAVLAVFATWAVHAGIDWDWQIPAVTAGPLALAAVAVAVPPAGPQRSRRRFLRGPASRLWLATGALLLAVAPALVAVSQQRLDDSVRAFGRGDCTGALNSALSSLDAMRIRPEPFEVIGYCDARLGLTPLATSAMRSAIERDPDNWELHYGLALVRGAGGKDPRPAVRAAIALNPRESLLQTARAKFDTSSPRRWAQAARGLPLTVSGSGR
jgi:hypothetical protein